MRNLLYPFVVTCGILITMLSSKEVEAQFMLDSTSLDTSVLLSGLDHPWDMKYGPDGYIYFTERYGRISRVHPDSGVQHVIADISNQVLDIGASGLLGLELHPNFLDTPYLYTIYTYDVDSASLYMNERLVRFEFDGTSLINQTTLVDSIGASIFVAGSRMMMGPDRKLYITTGCTQDFTQAQNLQSKSGKVLRVNLDGSVPNDNPYSGNLVWSLGHRNPQGLYYDHQRDILYSAEHGPHNDDEINIIQKGKNYGWPYVEGYCDLPGEAQFCADSTVEEPIFSYTPTSGISEVIYYEGNVIPEFENSLLQLSLKNHRVYHVKLDSSGTEILYQKQYFHYEFGRMRDILQIPDGRIFICGQPASNPPFHHFIFEFKPAGKPSCPAPKNLDTVFLNNNVRLRWDSVPGATQYKIEARVLTDGPWVTSIVNAPKRNIDILNMDPGFYGWKVSAICGNDVSPATAMQGFQVGAYDPPSSCPIPDPPFTSDIKRTSAKLNWDPVDDVQTHIVRGGVANTPIENWIYANTQSNQNNFTIYGLTPGVTYLWQVRAVCDTVAGDTSEWSQVGTFITETCPAPEVYGASQLSSRSALLNWDADPSVQNYRIWGGESDSSDSEWIYINTNSNSGEYLRKKLKKGRSYSWQVQAICDSISGDTSDWSVMNNFSTIFCPEPTGLTSVLHGLAGVKISWDIVPNAVSYEVWAKEKSFQQPIKIVTNHTSTSFIYNNLNPYKQFIWSVIAYCDTVNRFTSGLAEPYDTFTLVEMYPQSKTLDEHESFVDVFPNPSSGNLQLMAKNADDNSFVIRIFDPIGKIVYEEIIAEKGTIRRSIDLSEMPKGVYLLTANNGKTTLQEKVIIH